MKLDDVLGRFWISMEMVKEGWEMMCYHWFISCFTILMGLLSFIDASLPEADPSFYL